MAGPTERLLPVLAAPAERIAELGRSSVGIIESIDEHTPLLTTGADNLDLLALHIGLIGVPFRVVEPDELRVRIVEIAVRLHAGAAASCDAARAPSTQPARSTTHCA